YQVRSQVEQINQTLFQERLFSRLTSFFGALAALLACVGIYGIMAFAVTRRTREIGIRIALGASRGGIAEMILRETLAGGGRNRHRNGCRARGNTADFEFVVRT